MLERFFTIKELSSQLHITRQHIYDLLKNGKFPRGCKFGRLRRWSEAEIAQWTQATRVKGDADNAE